MKDNKLIFLTGPSWVWKTSIVEHLQEGVGEGVNIICRSFDKEVERPEEMWEGWQKNSCIDWVKSISETWEVGVTILDMQCNIDFVLEGITKGGFTDYEVVLVTCDTDIMEQRLQKRGQPELFTADMINWKSFLERQAKENNLRIINTGSLTIKEWAEELMNNIKTK
jgi:broad-specificity NMP kinase